MSHKVLKHCLASSYYNAIVAWPRFELRIKASPEIVLRGRVLQSSLTGEFGYVFVKILVSAEVPTNITTRLIKEPLIVLLWKYVTPVTLVLP